MKFLGCLLSLCLLSSICMASETAAPHGDVGRYVILGAGDPVILLDTATGDTWLLVKSGLGPEVELRWRPMARLPAGAPPATTLSPAGPALTTPPQTAPPAVVPQRTETATTPPADVSLPRPSSVTATPPPSATPLPKPLAAAGPEVVLTVPPTGRVGQPATITCEVTNAAREAFQGSLRIEVGPMLEAKLATAGHMLKDGALTWPIDLPAGASKRFDVQCDAVKADPSALVTAAIRPTGGDEVKHKKTFGIEGAGAAEQTKAPPAEKAK